MWNAILGALVIGSLGNGLDLSGASAADKLMFSGAILLLAVAIDAVFARRQPGGTTMTEPFVWSDREKAMLDAILDQIIPANAERGIPSAASLGLSNHLAMVATEDPALATRFREGLARADTPCDR